MLVLVEVSFWCCCCSWCLSPFLLVLHLPLSSFSLHGEPQMQNYQDKCAEIPGLSKTSPLYSWSRSSGYIFCILSEIPSLLFYFCLHTSVTFIFVSTSTSSIKWRLFGAENQHYACDSVYSVSVCGWLSVMHTVPIRHSSYWVEYGISLHFPWGVSLTVMQLSLGYNLFNPSRIGRPVVTAWNVTERVRSDRTLDLKVICPRRLYRREGDMPT